MSGSGGARDGQVGFNFKEGVRKVTPEKRQQGNDPRGGFGVITWKSHYSGYDVKLS